MAVARDIFVKLHMHEAIFGKRVHLARFGFTRLQKTQRLRNWHLIDNHLPFSQRIFRNAVTCLDDSRLTRMGGHGNICSFLEECPDGNGIGRIISALIDNFEHIILTENCRRHLHAACAPAIRHRHFTACERNLIARNSNGFQDSTTDHPLCLLVQIGEIVIG